ncbi:2-oxoglutarate dehydrogenase complex dihydrolipoyllysine-residue succinyltransferase [Halorhodospira sp. 9621]|uniref:2-oxoglutarate dehydrogenase complex dihydrolipoyllysine-residue succinyltransferase n=2 Tax=Ectothiorhodospiraceae TaxID=72276 RepID=UPI001EE94E4F|nr:MULTISPECIES: 2-oxoglutarate dehydrogenase complex dihydrolipoyllysine-residue succinyltransferase [Halorhodospira]MCG5526993.1 2-oxoglutarate dehydrogenase complex dihydrolipoyllysine-residue succinyltransferase [Halorhodospira halophila]MCG5532386.1 2-oxoglutarate dehydrogenase complex dihydrolipoyllysine-residue succinyltransferase [Halorhodospira sp. 9621]MCG5537986.1 2-oxoglutarate dehydrogenase complex dihydrolipoyllysine-residue succinyltransferase [Halorhodospira sp. 9622]MCG5542670.
MSVEIKVPALPESVSEATVVAWHKQPGEAVSQDENLVDLETDKVVLEVPAPADGVLQGIDRAVGDTVTPDDILGHVEAGAAAATDDPPAAETAAAAAAGGQASDDAEPAPQGGEDTAPEAPVAAADAEAAPAASLDGLSPAVRRLVREHGLDPARIESSSGDGRLTKEDVLRHLERRAEAEAAPTAVTAPQSAPAAEAAPLGDRPEQRVPMTRLRQRIAERLVEAQQTAAMLTTFNEVDMQPVMDLRARYRERFEKAHDVRLGFMSFFVKAAVEALKRYPAVNASIDGNDIIYHGYYDIGIAVSSPRGLVVPVLRDADRLSFAEIESQINELGKRAQQGKLSMDELTGGTFTITNGGIFGSLLSTPILNPPQSGILGMHKIQERPVVEDGEIVVRPMMYLAHTYDHRIIDGREAVQFLVAVKDCIEDPARLLLEI